MVYGQLKEIYTLSFPLTTYVLALFHTCHCATHTTAIAWACGRGLLICWGLYWSQQAAVVCTFMQTRWRQTSCRGRRPLWSWRAMLHCGSYALTFPLSSPCLWCLTWSWLVGSKLESRNPCHRWVGFGQVMQMWTDYWQSRTSTFGTHMLDTAALFKKLIITLIHCCWILDRNAAPVFR